MTDPYAAMRGGHSPAGAYLPVGQMEGDCRICHEPWPCPTIAAALPNLTNEDPE